MVFPDRPCRRPGKIQEGEFEQAAQRELIEELGVSIAPTGLSHIFLSKNSNPDRSGEAIEEIFIADITDEKIIVEKEEFIDYKFLDFAATEDILYFKSHKNFLRKIDERLL